MKRCPHCGREYDNSMMFCLDDGSALLYGPGSPESHMSIRGEIETDPQTAILHDTSAPSEAGTMAAIHRTDRPHGGGPFGATGNRQMSIQSVGDGATRAIAVLPFRNIDRDGTDDYFCDGLTEEIISDLSAVRSLKVISRASSMKLKGTGKDSRTISYDLNVRYILDGSVRKAGQQIRISAQLIDGITDENLWADKYSGTLDDIFEIQESVSRSIVEALKITLKPDEERRMDERKFSDSRAYDLYLRARAEYGKGVPAALDRSISILKQGLEIIGENELLYAALGYSYYFYFRWISKLDENYLKLANECLEKVYALNPNSSHGFALQGWLSYSGGDIDSTIHSLKKAIEIDPSNSEALMWLGIFCLYQENSFDVAMKYVDDLLALDPLTAFNQMTRPFIYIYNGDFETPKPLISRALALDSSAPITNWLALIAKAWCGQTQEAIALADRLAELAPRWVYTQHGLFLKHALLGEREEALKYDSEDLAKESQFDCHFALHVSHCFALIGETDRALEFVKLALTRGMHNYTFVGSHDPLLANLRGDERFEQLIEDSRNSARLAS